MIRKICKKATVWLLAGVISLSAVTVQAAEVDNGASYPITTNAIEGWPQGPDTYSETAVLMDADTGTILYNKGMDEIESYWSTRAEGYSEVNEKELKGMQKKAWKL